VGDFSAWVTAPTPANGGFVESFYNSLHTGESGNVTHYSDPKLDALLVEGRGAVSVPDRKAVLAKITKLLIDAAPYALLFHQSFTTSLAKDIRGVQRWTISGPDMTALWKA